MIVVVVLASSHYTQCPTFKDAVNKAVKIDGSVTAQIGNISGAVSVAKVSLFIAKVFTNMSLFT